jgi:hypothetical protein
MVSETGKKKKQEIPLWRKTSLSLSSIWLFSNVVCLGKAS